jgi:O-acetyl-ADP-ribose deacetylase (regulator of RNase III)
MKLLFCDLNEQMIKAWNKNFSEDTNITIYHGSIFEKDSDAIVSPANSFGFMDGGLDLQISKFFGWHVQERLQEIIKKKHHGELLVGYAEIIETDHKNIPYIISAPTMRVPMILKESVNVYLATKAVLVLLKYGIFSNGSLIREKVNKIAIPGMGTGVGRLPYEICALQMKKAVDDIYYEKYTFPKTWYEAQKNHQLLYRKSTSDLQFEI